MNFTLSEPDFAMSCGNPSEIPLLLLLALVCATPVFLWLRRSEHDSRDTLHASLALPVRRSKHLLDAAAWVLPAAAILLPLLAALKLFYALLFLDPVALMMGISSTPETVGTAELDLLSRDGVLTLVGLGAWLVLRQQLRRSEPDVLNLHARA